MIEKAHTKTPADGKAGEQFATGSFDCPHCKKVHPAFVSRCTETGEHVDRAFKMKGALLDGKYRVDRMIAKGGMGVVYEGTHERLDRKVAIKFLLSEYHASKQMLTRFQNEARLAASVGHRNIVEILDMGETEDSMHFMIMEYLDGRDLGEILDESVRLTPHVAVDLVIQILSALKAVHEQGIIHRDLKPENVFVGAEPGTGLSVKILDFGISRLGREDYANLNLTRTGAVFGTPGYMAPEQARGSKHIDRRTDLYACGVMLYEMLTGSLPFNVENYNEMIIAITTEMPIHVGRHGISLPDGLMHVVMRAISREPDSAAEFFEALRPFRSPEAYASEPATTQRPRAMLDWSGAAGSGRPAGRAALPSNDSAFIRDSSLDQIAPRGVSLLETPSAGRHRSPTPDSVGHQDLVITIDPCVERGNTPYPVPGAGAWHEHGRTGAGRSLFSVPPDTSISLDGWEGPVSAPPPRPRRLPVPRWLLVASAALLLLAASGALTLVLIKARGLEQRVSAVQAADAGPVQAVEPEPAVPEAWSVVLEDLPDAAEVYVDGALHPERPLAVARTRGASTLRILCEGFEPWEREIAIHADMELVPDLIPAADPVHKSKKKKKSKKTRAQKRPKIDKSYPGLI
ncbi:MAG: protein kinase [Deltaproteobacteria bacterium]|nr:protein kinase [Deltaproteobacteria bacterium]